jgi:hypothetical protein
MLQDAQQHQDLRNCLRYCWCCKSIHKLAAGMPPRNNLLLMLGTGGQIYPPLLLLTAYFLPGYSQHFNWQVWSPNGPELENSNDNASPTMLQMQP